MRMTPFRRVELHGLSRAELNGSRGVCVAQDTGTGRITVRLLQEPPVQLNIKPCNLRPAWHPEYPRFSELERDPRTLRTRARSVASHLTPNVRTAFQWRAHLPRSDHNRFVEQLATRTRSA